MPDAPLIARSSLRRQAAVSAVGTWLDILGGVLRPFGPDELRLYTAQQVTDGWRLEVQFPDQRRSLDLIIVSGFPRLPPKVALVDRPKFLTWPHIEEDGVLCVLPESAAVIFSQPVEVAKNVLALACDLIADLAAGRRMDDFCAEFNSYWNRSVKDRTPTLYTLVNPAPPTRLVRVWRGRRYHLLGDELAIKTWLKNRFSKDTEVSLKTEPAIFLWLDHPLLPSEFPNTGADILKIARRCDGHEMLEQLAFDGMGSIITLIGAPTANGPCLAGVVISAPSAPGQETFKSDKATPGFRPGKAPRKLLVKRHLGGAAILRSTAERADASWVHGRDQDMRFARLRAATVAVIGCGSVGAPVVLQLASSGVGRFLLIDPKVMTWANVGRHPLGAVGVGFHKAEMLAERVRSHYPHIQGVQVLTCRWQDVIPETLKTLANCELIISATGDWATEGALNEWHRTDRRGPTVYGWTEAHACAGHAVAIFPNCGCFQCGLTHNGMPLLRVADWPQGVTLRQEPACGAVFQPYGPVELGHVISVIAELALDCLVGSVIRSTHRIWAARKSVLDSVGGSWTPEWAKIAQNRLAGGFVEEREWPQLHSCVECGAGAA